MRLAEFFSFNMATEFTGLHLKLGMFWQNIDHGLKSQYIAFCYNAQYVTSVRGKGLLNVNSCFRSYSASNQIDAKLWFISLDQFRLQYILTNESIVTKLKKLQRRTDLNQNFVRSKTIVKPNWRTWLGIRSYFLTEFCHVTENERNRKFTLEVSKCSVLV